MGYIEPDFEMDCKPLNEWIHAAILAVRQWIAEQTATSEPPTKRLGTSYKPQVPPEGKPDLLTHAVLRQNFTTCLGFLDWLPDKPVDAIEELERVEKEGQKVGRALPDAYKRRASKNNKSSGNAGRSGRLTRGGSSGTPASSSSRRSSGMTTRSSSKTSGMTTRSSSKTSGMTTRSSSRLSRGV
ncbi:hypothetical protein H0H87_003372 [Tephrocybe sp. NHM501043]|nr:hypothetical protein H0H87_003372 [Tephrocybe sp. NHM501043]